MATERQLYADHFSPVEAAGSQVDALRGSRLLVSWEWAEPKADGVWCRVEIAEDGTVIGYGRNGRKLFDYTCEGFGAIAPATIVGEYIDGSGWSRAHDRDQGRVIAFDCTTFGGRDVSAHPRWHRRELMIAACKCDPDGLKPIAGQYIDPNNPDALADLWRLWVDLAGWEGLVLKSFGPYRVSLLRLKQRVEVDYVCTGFEVGEGRTVKSVRGGLYNSDGVLVECVRAHGLCATEKREIYKNRRNLTGQTFKVLASATSDKGTARHPIFAGWHADKPPAECVMR